MTIVGRKGWRKNTSLMGGNVFFRFVCFFLCYRRSRIPPNEWFRLQENETGGPKYTACDEEGIPPIDPATGEPLSKVR